MNKNPCIPPHIAIGRHCIMDALFQMNRDISPNPMTIGAPVKLVKPYNFKWGEWVKLNGKLKTRPEPPILLLISHL